VNRGFLAGMAVAAACVCQPIGAYAGSCIVDGGGETYAQQSGVSGSGAIVVSGGSPSAPLVTEEQTETRFMTIVCTPVRAIGTLLRGIIMMVN